MASFKYHKLLERPFIVYAGVVSILIPTGETQNMHMHKASSAC